MTTLGDLVTRVKRAGEDPDDVEVVFRDGREQARRAESAGSAMMTLDAEEILLVHGTLILTHPDLDEGL